MLPNYKYAQPTLGLSVTFVFNIEPFFCNKENIDTWCTQYIQHVTLIVKNRTTRGHLFTFGCGARLLGHIWLFLVR